MKICVISDTHNQHENLILPDADILIHCEDMSLLGSPHEIQQFFNWFGSLNQYKYKICIAGNHDFLLENYKLMALSYIPTSVFYLEDDFVTINDLKFYWTPVQNTYNWAFSRNTDK